MANTKISQLPSATTPVVGTEVLPIVQSSTTSKVSIANLTAGRAVTASSYDATGATAPANGMFSLTAGTLAFSVSSSQIGKFLSGGGVGAFEVDDAASAGYNARRYISVTNLNTGTGASASVFSSAFSTQANLTAFSPSHTTTALANKAVMFGSNRSSNASSGTVIADFSTGTNQIQFYVGTTGTPVLSASVNSTGDWNIGQSNSTNGSRYIQVTNVDTGTSAYSSLTARSDVQTFNLQASSSTRAAVGGVTLAGKAVLYATKGSGGVTSTGLTIWDDSTGPQIDFVVGSTYAGTIGSTGQWNLYDRSVQAGSFIPTSSTVPTNGMYLPSAYTISITNNSAVTASFTNLNNFDVGTGNSTNSQRYITATNVSALSSAFTTVAARSDAGYANLQAYSSTYSSASPISSAGKAALYTTMANGLLIWDNSTSPSINFIVGASSTAASINSSAVLSLTNNPILSGGTINGVAYLNGSKILTTGTGLVFDGANLGVGVTSPVSQLHLYPSTANVFTEGLRVNREGQTGQYTIVNYASGIGRVVAVDSLFNTPSLGFFTSSDGSTQTERARIDSSGNLLVGVTSGISGFRLNVGSSTTINNSAILRNDGTQTLSFTLAAAGLTSKAISATTDGRVYIFSNADTATGQYMTSGGTSWNATSDERLKENLTPITDAVNKISTLRAVVGNYISDENKTPTPFLIAQDVQAVLPEAVDASNENELGLSYTGIIPLLVAAIKEQQAIITTLTDRLAALEAK